MPKRPLTDENRRFGSPAAPRAPRVLDGVLPVDKPSGPTSHDIVDAIRRRFGIRKAGHGGTLDPQATGLLVILLGRGTKLSQHFVNSDKRYEGVLRLGIATDTHDRDGIVLREADFSAVTRARLEEEMAARTGDMMQQPPMVSAVKVGGVPLYRRARKGQTVRREPRLIHVYEFQLHDFDPPLARFSIRCTKGTYVRTLCAEMGDALGCGAHLAELRRVQTGNLRIENALPFAEILRMNKEELARRVIPIAAFAPSSRPG